MMPRVPRVAGVTVMVQAIAGALWPRHGGANQRWRVTNFYDQADNHYTWFRITNVHSGMALVHEPDTNTFVQQPAGQPLSDEGWDQVWAMGYPGFAGSSYDPAKPAQPHPTGSDGVRVRFKGAYRTGGVVAIAAPETSGTHLSSTESWPDFETGWKFVAA